MTQSVPSLISVIFLRENPHSPVRTDGQTGSRGRIPHTLKCQPNLGLLKWDCGAVSSPPSFGSLWKGKRALFQFVLDVLVSVRRQRHHHLTFWFGGGKNRPRYVSHGIIHRLLWMYSWKWVVQAWIIRWRWTIATNWEGFFFFPSPNEMDAAFTCEFQTRYSNSASPSIAVTFLHLFPEFSSASDWERSSRKFPTQSCGLWYWPRAAIKVASLGCGCHQRRTPSPVSEGGSGLEEALVPVSCVSLPSPLRLSLTNYLPAPCRRVLGLCLIVISCWCLSPAVGSSLSFTVSDFVWILLFHVSWLDSDRLTGCWPDMWVQHPPLRITDLILPFLSTSFVHFLLCCAVNSVLR